MHVQEILIIFALGACVGWVASRMRKSSVENKSVCSAMVVTLLLVWGCSMALMIDVMHNKYDPSEVVQTQYQESGALHEYAGYPSYPKLDLRNTNAPSSTLLSPINQPLIPLSPTTPPRPPAAASLTMPTVPLVHATRTNRAPFIAPTADDSSTQIDPPNVPEPVASPSFSLSQPAPSSHTQQRQPVVVGLDEVRSDGRCGKNNRAPNGNIAKCRTDKTGNELGPCCSDSGFCGDSPAHCKCVNCVDHSLRPGEVRVEPEPTGPDPTVSTKPPAVIYQGATTIPPAGPVDPNVWARGENILPFSMCESLTLAHAKWQTVTILAASAYHTPGNEQVVDSVDFLVYLEKGNNIQFFMYHCSSEDSPVTPLSCIWESPETLGVGPQETKGKWLGKGYGMRISCPAPANWDSSISQFSITLQDTAFKLSHKIPICRQYVDQIHDLAVCAGPAFNHDYVQKTNPGLVDNFIAYHLDLMGASLLHFMDLDASFYSAIKPWLSDPRVLYTGNFTISDAARALNDESPQVKEFPELKDYCSEMYAHDRCLWNMRFRAKYVYLLHGLDCFVHAPRYTPTRGTQDFSPPVLEFLKNEGVLNDGESVAEFQIKNMPFGGSHTDGASTVIDKFLHRSRRAVQRGRETTLYNPRKLEHSTIHRGLVYRNTERPVTKVVPEDTMRINHYFEMYRIRGDYPWRYDTADDSILWATDLLPEIIHKIHNRS